MNKVYAVQELRRYHCPECDGTYIKFERDLGKHKCQTDRCGAVFDHGVSKPVNSLSEASVYGDIEILVQTDKIGIALQPLVAQMKSKLKDFDDTDYILPVGDPVAIGLATTLAANANRGRVQFLRWERNTRSYIKINVETR